MFGPYGEPHESNRVLNYLSVKEKLKDKFEQLYSAEFKDPLSRTSSMSVENRIALSESAFGIADYTRSENVSRQVHCSFLLTKFKVVKPKTEAPSANKPKSTLRKPKEKKDTKLKVKTTKRPKATVTKNLGNLIICIIGFIAVWNQKSSLLRMIEDHLKDFLRGLMTEYVSLRSGTPASLFTASVMVMLNCCGATYRQFDWRYANFDPVDTYDNILYHGENK
ncbi:unnamed protein product [Schistosoma mattheei]|uniref:Uncharacterized protein n=1 Tax=Schistosoma mattheei TaxID=31246 RepID=A0A3P8FSM1_9TREM|nr:unnamed protein product [Schistosoma mattheei]